MEEFIYPAPVCFGDAARVGLVVADGHRLGAQARVLCEAFGGDAEEFGLKVCERAVVSWGTVVVEVVI